MNIIEIKVILEYIEPAVTRTLQVPVDIRLDRLHLTLQAAMGWTNSHLYMFEAEAATWGLPDPDFGGDDLPANKTTLAEVLTDTGARSIRYIYDFGDSWEHRLQIGEFTDPKPGDLYPRLTDISGRCPPEDVGGFPGYEEFLDAMANPKHPEHASLKEWYGVSFDPSTPPADELRFEVRKLAKRWKPKKRDCCVNCKLSESSKFPAYLGTTCGIRTHIRFEILHRSDVKTVTEHLMQQSPFDALGLSSKTSDTPPKS